MRDNVKFVSRCFSLSCDELYSTVPTGLLPGSGGGGRPSLTWAGWLGAAHGIRSLQRRATYGWMACWATVDRLGFVWARYYIAAVGLGTM